MGIQRAAKALHEAHRPQPAAKAAAATLVFAEQGSLRQPFTHYAQPSTPDLYVYWQRFDPAYAGHWRITAERGDGKKAEVRTRSLAKPQQVPLVRKVRIAGAGTSPRVHWELPDLAGFDVERIRVAVRGEPRVHGRFLSELYVSGELPLSATAFTIPPDVLAAGRRYVFQVMLEDLEDGTLENRSIAFSEPYVVARQEAPGEFNSALSRSPRNFDRVDFRVVD